MALNVRVKVDFDSGLADRVARNLDRNMRVGMRSMVLPRLKRLVPVDRGVLRRSLSSRRVRQGLYEVYWDSSGYYFLYLPGLPSRINKQARQLVTPMFQWAIRKAIADAQRGIG